MADSATSNTDEGRGTDMQRKHQYGTSEADQYNPVYAENTAENTALAERLGQLVALGFDVAVFTPAPYPRPRLGRPSGSPHLAAGFALRCFQRLSVPGADTRQCPWRDNR